MNKMAKRITKLSHDVETNVIQQLQKYSVLWNVTHPEFNDKAKRDATLKAIITSLRLQISTEDLWEKIAQLKTAFARELNKVKEKQKKNELYEPRFVHYKRLLFLQNALALPGGSSVIQPLTGCAESGIYEVLDSSSDSSSASDEDIDTYESAAKVSKIGSSTNGIPSRRPLKDNSSDGLLTRAKLSIDEIQVAVNFLKAMDKEPEDECDMFGKYVASALRRMTPYNKELAKLKIQQVFLDLSLNSSLPTTQEPSIPML